MSDPRRRCARVITALVVCSVATACTWVKPTPAGETVREANADAVAACAHLGVVSGTTTDRIVLQRNAEVIRKEQVTLARNQASTMGADTLVAKGPATGPTLQFDVYRCH